MSGYAIALQLQRTRLGTRFANPRPRQTTRSPRARNILFHGQSSPATVGTRIQTRLPSHARRMVRERPRHNHNRLTPKHPTPPACLQRRQTQLRGQIVKRHGNHTPLLRPSETHQRNQARRSRLRRRHPRTPSRQPMALPLHLYHKPHPTNHRL